MKRHLKELYSEIMKWALTRRNHKASDNGRVSLMIKKNPKGKANICPLLVCGIDRRKGDSVGSREGKEGY